MPQPDGPGTGQGEDVGRDGPAGCSAQDGGLAVRGEGPLAAFGELPACVLVVRSSKQRWASSS